jgi:tRNA A37 threonylcarbamoyladenosine synthetase subunit TsaC/SUA5/YrdC
MTLVVPQRPEANLPAELTGGAATIGLRLPAHDSPRALALALGPLPVSSANLSGEPPGDTAEAVFAQLGDRPGVALVLDGGRASGALASTVVDCAHGPPRILREGAIPAAVLAATLDEAELEHRLLG